MSTINPRVAIAFKKIFGVEENKDILISLINAVVSEADHVCEITLLNPYNPQNFQIDKLSILDIKAQGKDGKKFNIEIQITDEASYDKRALYYWAKLYTEQLKRGESYDRLTKTIGIHILNFTSILNMEKYHNVFHVTEKETGERYFSDLELHTIELKKFTNNKSDKITDFVSKINNSLDMWVAFLTRHDLLSENALPREFNNSALKKALNILEEMNFTEQERESYEAHLKWFRMEASAIEKVSKENREIGRAEGRAEGRAQGRTEGRAEGIQIGEIRAAEKIATKMLAQKIDVSLISSATGLSCEHIVNLRKTTEPI